MDGPPAEFPAGLHGELSPGFERVGERTALVHRRHRGPSLVRSPFHPEGPNCHCHLRHSPGDVVGGDTLSLRPSAASKAHALLTTPGARFIGWETLCRRPRWMAYSR